MLRQQLSRAVTPMLTQGSLGVPSAARLGKSFPACSESRFISSSMRPFCSVGNHERQDPASAAEEEEIKHMEINSEVEVEDQCEDEIFSSVGKHGFQESNFFKFDIIFWQAKC
jgi:hypothetical protein